MSVVALVLLSAAVAGAGGAPGRPPAGQTGAVMKTTTIGSTTVLTNGQGFTLYWFAPDTPARSACNGACAQYWPPVTAGRARRHRAVGRDHPADGSTQATYGRHPLYTYVAGTGPGKPMATTST